MENIIELKKLEEISNYVGNRISDVQGGGGNTSVKYKNFMAVKASGYALKDLNFNSGFAVLDMSYLLPFLMSKNLNEDDFDSKLSSFMVSKKYNKPSMEAGLHSLLNYKYVAHTHSAYVNIFTCAKEGKKILKKHFPDSLWVDYATPGLDLFKQVRISLSIKNNHPRIIFLQNHGVFICSNNHKELIQINNDMNNFLLKEFNLPKFYIHNYLKKEKSSNLLFPDQAVYLDNINNENESLSKAALETICTINYILSSIRQLGLKPNYLPNDEKHKLLNLESEKYRKKLEK